MKVFILKDSDLERLIGEIERDPRHTTGEWGSLELSETEREAFKKAHRFYNYLVRRWIDSVKGEGR